jgi:hypothetical protein
MIRTLHTTPSCLYLRVAYFPASSGAFSAETHISSLWRILCGNTYLSPHVAHSLPQHVYLPVVHSLQQHISPRYVAHSLRQHRFLHCGAFSAATHYLWCILCNCTYLLDMWRILCGNTDFFIVAHSLPQHICLPVVHSLQRTHIS